jgi:hypothetical protein
MKRKRTKVERRAALLRRKVGGSVLKACGKCGAKGYYLSKERACQALVGLLGTYRCSGTVSRVKRTRRTVSPEKQRQRLEDALHLLSVGTAIAKAEMRDASAKFMQARRRYTKLRQDMKRTERRLAKLPAPAKDVAPLRAISITTQEGA